MSIKDDKLTLALELFHEQMKNRLGEKKRQGFIGWDDPLFESWDIPRRMLNKVVTVLIEGKNCDKSDLVDVANFAMMLHSKIEEE